MQSKDGEMHGLGGYIYWGLIALPVSVVFVGFLIRRIRKGGYAHWAWALLACILYALVPALGTAIYSFDDHICVPAGLAPRHGPEELFETAMWTFSMFWACIPLPVLAHAWGRARRRNRADVPDDVPAYLEADAEASRA